MHTETDILKMLAVEIAAKTKEENENTIPDKHFLAEANRLQKSITNHLLAIDNFPQRESFYFNTLTKLVDICDILYQDTNIVSADVIVLLELLTEIKKVLPTEISPDLKLPKVFAYIQKDKLIII